jgi:nitrogen fixation/metabolism regulation signal transduction histidine kinase
MPLRRSLAGGLLLRLLPAFIAAAGSAAAVGAWLDEPWAGALAGLMVGLVVGAVSVQRTLAPVLSMFRALAGTALSYRDGDYSFGLSWPRRDELGDLVDAHNAIGSALREQQLDLVQRELLLDTMVQNTPVTMILLDASRRVVFANLAARRLVGHGRRIEGQSLDTLADALAPALADALRVGEPGVFACGDGDEEEVYHLSASGFRLNQRDHRLLLLRQITTELRRQEVQIWKKVIRVISHELNNSLAPMASLAHSGAELARRGQVDRLPAVFATIEDRARHLEGFLRDYARFAKLPNPRLEPIALGAFVERLASQIAFAADLDGHQPDGGVLRADPAQIEQALLNLLKNAQEAGGPADQVRLRIRRGIDAWRIEVLDRGPGMTEVVMANALVPFYSTKRSGTGLGLALVREIVEAHGGRVSLANREGGGLCVSLLLPA